MTGKIAAFLDRAIGIFETVFLSVSIAVMACTLFAQVFLGFFGVSLAWAGELAMYLMVWVMCIGASAAVRSRSHIAVGLIADRLRGAPALVLRTAVLFFCFLLCVGALILGVRYAAMTYTADMRSVAMKLPMWIVYSALPAAAVLMAVRVVLLGMHGFGVFGNGEGA